MKTIKIIIAILIITSAGLKAQTVIKWSKEMKNDANHGSVATNATAILSYDIIGNDKDEIFVISTKKGLSKDEYFFQKYSKANLDLIVSKQLDFTNPVSSEVQFIKAVYMKGKIFVFTQAHNKKAKTKWAYAQEISQTGELRPVSEIYKNENQKYSEDVFFDIRISDDSEKLLCYKKEYHMTESPTQPCSFKVFDNNLKELWEATYEVQYKNYDASIQNAWIDNTGNAHMLIKTRDSYKEKTAGYRTISYFMDTKQFKEFNMEIENKSLRAVNCFIDKENNLICSGFYCDAEKTNSTKGDKLDGAFYIKVDAKTKEISNKEFNVLNKNTIAQLDIGKLNSPSYQFGKLNIIGNEADRSITLFAEQSYISNSPGLSYSTFFNYNILVVEINPEGKIIWEKIIPKAQKTISRETYSSYSFTHSNNRLYFIYNDNTSNITEMDVKKISLMDALDKSSAVLVQLDGKGEMQKEELFNTGKAGLIFVSAATKQISPSEVIIYAENQNVYKFGNIVLSR
jgi:hypothetical protein